MDIQNQLGQIFEYKFLISALELNWDIAQPVGAGTLYKYDFLLFIGNQWKRVQVKGTSKPRNSGHVIIDLRHGKRTRSSGINVQVKNRRYSDNDYDYLGAVYMENVWLIPKSVIGVNCIHVLSENFAQYKIK